ncbi:hypothetical protein PMAYCL1PPCAC_25172, partial [Pristionchus mayeri]
LSMTRKPFFDAECWHDLVRRGFDAFSYHNHIDFLIAVFLLVFIYKQPLLREKYKDFAVIVAIHAYISAEYVLQDDLGRLTNMHRCQDFPVFIKVTQKAGFFFKAIMQAVIHMLLLQYFSRHERPLSPFIVVGVPVAMAIFPVYTGLCYTSFSVLLGGDVTRCMTGFANIGLAGYLLWKGCTSTHFPLLAFAHELVYVPCDLIIHLPTVTVVSNELHIFVQEADGFWWWIVAVFATVLFCMDIKGDAKPEQNTFQNETFV